MAVDMPMMPPPIITKSYIRSIPLRLLMRLVVVRGVSEIATLAHQFTAQIPLRSKSLATVQQEHVVNQQEFPNGNVHGKNAFARFNSVGKLAHSRAFFEVFQLDELVDIAHHRATLLIDA